MPWDVSRAVATASARQRTKLVASYIWEHRRVWAFQNILFLSMKIPKELQEAIVQMPDKEKNKLLLRLVAKDPLLVEKLQHQLLEGTADVTERRRDIEEKIAQMAEYQHYETPGWLMMSMRDRSGDITRHVKVTKDKLGEVQLTLQLVNLTFEKQQKMLRQKSKKAENFAEYVVKKADSVMKKLSKIHPDYFIELEDEVNQMLAYVHGYEPCQFFLRQIEVPKRWNP